MLYLYNHYLAEKVRTNLSKGRQSQGTQTKVVEDKGRQPQGTQTKVVEDGGVCARNVLTKSNPFPREECGRNDCVMCSQREIHNPRMCCSRMNVGYEGECARCELKHTYIGETSRTAYTRIKEHLSNYRAASAANLPAIPSDRWGGGEQWKKDSKSWMWEHSRDCHGGQVGDGGGIDDYKFKVSGAFKKCLNRQVDEGLRMTASESLGVTLLNSKNEFYTPKIVMPVFRQQ